MRVLGFDPGATTGYALLEVGGAKPTLVRSGSLRDIWVRSAGGTLVPELGIRVALQSAELVAIEDVRAVYPRERFGVPMATAIAYASKVAGTILGYCRTLGVPTIEVTAAVWRKALVGKAQASDALIKAVLLHRIAGWPTRSTAHVRDAAGVALFAGLKRQVLGHSAIPEEVA